MDETQPGPCRCVVIDIRGLVQGVGFRPFVYHLARELNLGGYVVNTGAGVRLEAEGHGGAVDAFMRRLRDELPPLARIDGWNAIDLPPHGHGPFEIRESDRGGAREALVSPDVATCADCLREINDPADRRYRYPFTNCTNCGPRYSIITDMPYDRPGTTMADFALCQACRREYGDPSDRRFHAQPIACPDCGPQLALWTRDGTALTRGDEALNDAVAALRAGSIVALKGLGGFQLLADAADGAAVQTLRDRKHREAKPFALMVPDLDRAAALGMVAPAHAALLRSPQAPIVLLPARPDGRTLAPQIAPDTSMLGVMLPYTPLHHLLLAAFGGPLVVTSGNRGEEPICIDEGEALARLGSIADLFLVHDRPIARQVDDSIVSIIAGEPMMIRRARGYAPAPLPAATGTENVLAVGGHLKNSVAFTRDSTIFPSQHIGNLENVLAETAFQTTVESLGRLLDVRPVRAVCDAHPDYASTRFAQDSGLPTVPVQHHYAHVLSCMAEHGLAGPVLGVSWDGTGYGDDGTVWGGEFLACTREGFQRVASLRPFRLPGGDAAARDGRRAAFSLLHEVYGGSLEAMGDLPVMAALTPEERKALGTMIARGVNAPWCTSMGRLFDAVASLCGFCQHSAFEGQAAMRLECAARACTGGPGDYRLAALRGEERWLLDWQPLMEGIIADLGRGDSVESIAAGFHEALAVGILEMVRAQPLRDIVLTGGCFQNTLLHERALQLLRDGGYRVYRHRLVPPNDGGLSVGQAWYRPDGKDIPCV